ncbi:MAG: hypothetical protein AAFQ22_05960 [Pseudomonadota bacterium]
MTPNDRASLAWSLGYAARRLEGALALAAPSGALGSHVLRGVWRSACRELYFLELFVRRLLVYMAGQIAVAPCSRQVAASASPRENTHKTPVFPVFDRCESLNALQKRLGAIGHWEGEVSGQAPDPRSGNTSPEPAPAMPAARLAARFAALADVLERPQHHARRLARWRARRAAAALRLGTVPSLARGGPLDLATSSYFEAERLALTVLNRGWRPPQDPPEPPPDAASRSKANQANDPNALPPKQERGSIDCE